MNPWMIRARHATGLLAVCCSLSLLLGCMDTHFQGSPQFPGGVRGCWEHCRREGLVMGSFVFVGEYSSACVCRLPTSPGATAEADSGALVAAAAGVEMQRQRQEQQRQMHQQQMMQTR